MPPLTTVGSKSPASSSVATIVVVVVLPCVPATAMLDLSRISSASISARRTTGRPRWRGPRRVRGCPVLIAEEMTTTSAPSRLSAACPSKIRAPRSSSRSVILERFQVRALHRVAEVEQHLGDAGHADPADSDEMDWARHRREAWWRRSFRSFPSLPALRRDPRGPRPHPDGRPTTRPDASAARRPGPA